jgi:hypothetical protein
VRVAEFQCVAIQPIQMPTPSQMTARMSAANTIRQIPISAQIFMGFIPLTTAPTAASAEQPNRKQIPPRVYVLPLDAPVGAR